ncbi:hypothetical protein VA7868_01142 [Vibrio aerogenes CECT 7868]|uniref:Prolyl 4-hydroxylase alpha subunit Fe(2+) 2OG dioxygenase domain-containing protein n=1 Tax=Vibrio aerogenes CECT 7868 TaxID=1216006 RepID=A0A1M5XGJ4_9VIBR|nr:2OG-Fe(II) oxygenase [Vibrio aerogenes]SHH98624.1 hypothetical protein VA7868_01142 [Vibrio aerogenes CECT 7868]
MFRKKTPFLYQIDSLETLGSAHHEAYNQAEPFRHIVLDHFLPEKEAKAALKAFPKPTSDIWLDWTKRDTVHQPKKQGIGHASRLKGVDPDLLTLLHAFNAYPFLNFLEKLTGIKGLLPDPYFNGGGLHQILSGGKLAVHTDFNHLESLNIYRRLNVIFYLNQDWKDSYNGHLELWDKHGKTCVKSVAPRFNRLVVFNTDKGSLHGHPKPLSTPDGVTRKSIALYYYTASPSQDAEYNGLTDWFETD